jgi:catechol-2,3-dioxygenase
MCLFSDDVEGLHARLVAQGYASRGVAVETIAEGRHAGAKAVYMKDPDGYHVELYQRPSRSAQ